MPPRRQPRFRKAGDLRREQRVETRLAARAHRRQRAAMERMLEGDDLERAAAMDLAELARELDRAFVGFGSAVGEEAAIEPAQRGEALRQLEEALNRRPASPPRGAKAVKATRGLVAFMGERR